jgi:3-hydroxy acid dehydrogenase/malonic semialdehyde reductase
MKKTVFITGSTSGIGKATAELFAEKNFRLILCGRRLERLLNLKECLSSKTEIYILNFDVCDRNAVENAVASLPIEWSKIDILLNNAGNAHGLDPIQTGNPADWDAMIDANVKGLLYVSRIVIQGMVERKSGHIINIGSIAGKEVYPEGNVYCASKSAVDSITQGMRLDLIEHNIKVSAINPGLVDTEFSTIRFKGDAERAKNVYRGMDPLTAKDIAEILLFMVKCPSHVNIADILVLPSAQASAVKIKRI